MASNYVSDNTFGTSMGGTKNNDEKVSNLTFNQNT